MSDDTLEDFAKLKRTMTWLSGYVRIVNQQLRNSERASAYKRDAQSRDETFASAVAEELYDFKEKGETSTATAPTVKATGRLLVLHKAWEEDMMKRIDEKIMQVQKEVRFGEVEVVNASAGFLR